MRSNDRALVYVDVNALYVLSPRTNELVINPFAREIINSIQEDNVNIVFFSTNLNDFRSPETKDTAPAFRFFGEWVSGSELISKIKNNLPFVKRFTFLPFVLPFSDMNSVGNALLITSDPVLLRDANRRRVPVVNVPIKSSICPLSIEHCAILKNNIAALAAVSPKASVTFFLSLDIDYTILLPDGKTINPDLIFWIQNVFYYIDSINQNRAPEHKIQLKLGMTTARISDELEKIRRASIAPRKVDDLFIEEVRVKLLKELSIALPRRHIAIDNENIIATGKLSADGKHRLPGMLKIEHLKDYVLKNPSHYVTHTDDSEKELQAIFDSLAKQPTLQKNLRYIQVMPGNETSYAIPAETKHIIGRWKQKLTRMKAEILSNPLMTTQTTPAPKPKAKKSFFDFFRSRKSKVPAQPCSTQAVDPNQPTSRAGVRVK